MEPFSGGGWRALADRFGISRRLRPKRPTFSKDGDGIVMKLRLVAALLGLAIGGCAQSRSAKLPEGPPVGMEPVPSIHDTINRGANPAVARATLPDSANANWSGGSSPEQPPATGLAPRVATTQPPADYQAQPEPFAAPPAAAPAPLPDLEPEMAAARPPAATRSPLADQDFSPSSAPVFGGVHNDADELPPVEEIEADDAMLPPVAEPSAAPEPVAQPAPAPTPRPEAASLPRDEDPLLGPNPDLMPAMDDLVPSREAAAPKTKTDAPAPKPVAEPEPEPAKAPDLHIDLDLEPPTASAGAEEPLDLPDLAPAPVEDDDVALPELPPAAEPSASNSALPANQQTQTLAARTPAPRVDPAVRRASTAAAVEPTPIPSDHVADDPNLIEAGRTAARVGDEVITLRELVVAVKDQVARHGGSISQIPRDELNMIAQNILAALIERSLIVQEAKRQLKDPKQMDRILEAADKYWREEGLPPLFHQHMVENEPQLKEKLEGTGRSLESLKQNYTQEFIAQIFIHQKLSAKFQVELPEMLKYYNEHINDKEYQRPAQIVWRELLVEVDRHPSPAEARAKAEGLLAKLKNGEDFAKLAAAESEGPTLVKAGGGLMKTSPGSYAVAAVNQAIASMPPGQISGIIEGPSSLHIVRVESRRAAGPATFAELQDQIRQRLSIEKMNREREALLAKLRANTIVTTIFDGTASDPNQVLGR